MIDKRTIFKNSHILNANNNKERNKEQKEINHHQQPDDRV